MDVEKLKMILEFIDSLGEEARQFAIFYLSLNVGSSFVLHLIGAYLILYALMAGKKVILHAICDSALGPRVSESLGVYKESYSVWCEKDSAEVIREIKKLKEVERGTIQRTNSD